jgi:3-mercaptopropionate dioxygenase
VCPAGVASVDALSAQVLKAEQRVGDPDGYRSHLLHTEPDGSFSIVALVWRPARCGFAPPGDIHGVCNAGDRTAISIRVYGTDVSRIGTSARRYYDLPVVPVRSAA